MAFESKNGLESNMKIRLIQAAIIIALLCGLFIYTKVTAPSKNVADGLYRNPCCSDISVKDGSISYGGKTLAVKILNMKFGLTGYVNARFNNNSMKESAEETAISFGTEGGKRTLILRMDNSDYTFTSVENVKNQ